MPRTVFRTVAFQSTLPARGATTRSCLRRRLRRYFNPRSPHGERPWREPSAATHSDFNPRSPHGERRYAFVLDSSDGADFNPRSPHGERRGQSRPCASRPPISIHAPRTGSDTRGRVQLVQALISIHAPRTGSDAFRHLPKRFSSNFNPRSPHGERPPRQGGICSPPAISIHAPRTGSDSAK